ncbi:MAG: DnaD domain-containing protein [Chloroflexota bacterium]
MPEGGAHLPEMFFTQVLPRISDLAELKLVLEVFHLAANREESRVPLDDLMSPALVGVIAGPHSPEPGPERLRRIADRAVANDVLLRITERERGSDRVFLLPATDENRDIVRKILTDECPDASNGTEPELVVHRPNIFSLYERHIGPLTPLIAEELREAERAYPRRWIEEAIRSSVEYNKRSWRYVETILQRWEETGAPDLSRRVE